MASLTLSQYPSRFLCRSWNSLLPVKSSWQFLLVKTDKTGISEPSPHSKKGLIVLQVLLGALRTPAPLILKITHEVNNIVSLFFQKRKLRTRKMERPAQGHRAAQVTGGKISFSAEVLSGE